MVLLYPIYHESIFPLCKCWFEQPVNSKMVTIFSSLDTNTHSCRLCFHRNYGEIAYTSVESEGGYQVMLVQNA